MGNFRSTQQKIDKTYLDEANKLLSKSKNDELLVNYLSLVVYNYKDQIEIAKDWDTYLDVMKKLILDYMIVDKEHVNLLVKYYISDIHLENYVITNKLLLQHYFITRNLERYIKMLSVKEEFVLRMRTNTIKDYDKDLINEKTNNQIIIDYEITDSKQVKERTIENFKKRITLLNDLVQANINIGFTRKLNFEKYYTKIYYEENIDKINELTSKLSTVLNEIQFKLKLQNDLIDQIQKHIGKIEDKYYSLEECASYYSVSRERIRQIENKALTKLYYKFKDDSNEKELQYIYNFTYDMSMAQLIDYALLHPIVYLMNKDKEKNLDIQTYFANFNLTDTPLFDNYLNENSLVFFDGEYLKKNQATIFNYYVNKYLVRACSVDYIEQDYTSFLMQNGLSEFASFDQRTIEGLLDRNVDVVKSHSLHHVVKSEFKEEILNDFKKLLVKLPKVFSTKLIYDRKKKLYQKAEIKDYYELHNFLKKNYVDDNISYKRVPHIFIDDMTIEKFIIEKEGKMSLDEIEKETGIVLQTLVNIKSSLNQG